MEILLVIELVLLIIFAIMSACDDSDGKSVMFLILEGGVLATIICLGIEWGKPQAMDVYRGITTLEITYKDSVAVDSVVVFKDKYQ